MTETNIDALIAAADLSDRQDRNELADAMRDADTHSLSIKLLDSELPLTAVGSNIRPTLIAGGVESNGPDALWVNCSWAGKPLGGAWILNEDDANERNNCEGLHPHHPSYHNAGDAYPYEGVEMTGGTSTDSEYFLAEFGLDLDDEEAELLTEKVRRQSRLACQEVADEYAESLVQADIDEIEAEFDDASGRWVGLDWTHLHGDAQIDIDGMDADELRAAADAIDEGEESDHPYVLKYIKGDDDYYESALVEELRSAAQHIDSVAESAEEAEQAARGAWEAAEQRDWATAVRRAEEACEIEGRYGDCPTWGRLQRLIEDAAERHG